MNKIGLSDNEALTVEDQDGKPVIFERVPNETLALHHLRIHPRR
jgi:hypothetical protein